MAARGDQEAAGTGPEVEGLDRPPLFTRAQQLTPEVRRRERGGEILT
jgi:hypothetical protein